MTTMYRHGDVLLIRRGECEQLSGRAETAEVVVAEGEATGHAHRVIGVGAAIADMSDERTDGRRHLMLPRGGAISHEEHALIELPAGVYEVRIQQTMTQPGVWERVRD